MNASIKKFEIRPWIRFVVRSFLRPIALTLDSEQVFEISLEKLIPLYREDGSKFGCDWDEIDGSRKTVYSLEEYETYVPENLLKSYRSEVTEL